METRAEATMVTSPTCPRGHALEPNAVLCTVCWVRVEPVDPVVEAQRRRRRRRVWLPLMGASAIVLGVIVGGSVGILGHSTSTPSVAAEVPPPPAASSAASPSASPSSSVVPSSPTLTPVAEAPEAIAAVPLAATVAEWSRDVCAPDGTSSLQVSTRPDPQATWTAVEANQIPGPAASCESNLNPITVEVPSVPDTAIAIRVEYLADDGALIDKVRFSLG